MSVVFPGSSVSSTNKTDRHDIKNLNILFSKHQKSFTIERPVLGIGDVSQRLKPTKLLSPLY
jgi:hypothetical protein